MEYRIIRQTLSDDIAREAVWLGGDRPDADQVDHAKQLVIRLLENNVRSPFKQNINDTLIIQRCRTPALLGWKTIELINFFNNLD